MKTTFFDTHQFDKEAFVSADENFKFALEFQSAGTVVKSRVSS